MKLTIFVLSVLICNSTAIASSIFRRQSDEENKLESTRGMVLDNNKIDTPLIRGSKKKYERDLKSKNKEKKSKKPKKGGGGEIRTDRLFENGDCIPMTKEIYNSHFMINTDNYYTGEISTEKTCMCNSGCCRQHSTSRTLICDNYNEHKFLKCICNNNTRANNLLQIIVNSTNAFMPPPNVDDDSEKATTDYEEPMIPEVPVDSTNTEATIIAEDPDNFEKPYDNNKEIVIAETFDDSEKSNTNSEETFIGGTLKYFLNDP